MLRRAAVVPITLVCCSVAFGDDVKFAAGFAPEKSEFTLGDSIYLEFNLTNTGSNTIFLSIDSLHWGVTGCRIEALDASGNKVPDEYGDGHFIIDTVVGMTEIKPGSVYVDRFYLPTFIKFKQPGEYTVLARRGLGFVNISETNRLTRDGSFQSGDGLNWVDTYSPMTTDGRFDESFISVLAPSSSSYAVSNRFKLTVLPADKERLLKRVEEMLAKLDGIGARDPVAKTNGPRALDKLDWETEKSAWLVGQDNVDLAWAVRVLSDIGDRRIIPELKQHLNDNSMKVRFACVKVLCALGEPLRAEWIVPIIKSRQWGLEDDPEQFVADHGGPEATNILSMCLDRNPSLDGAYPGVWNVRIRNIMKILTAAALLQNEFDNTKDRLKMHSGHLSVCSSRSSIKP